MSEPGALGRLSPSGRLMVVESSRTALALARALSSGESAQSDAALALIRSMPREELAHVVSALATMAGGLVRKAGFDWNALSAEMERQIAS